MIHKKLAPRNTPASKLSFVKKASTHKVITTPTTTTFQVPKRDIKHFMTMHGWLFLQKYGTSKSKFYN
jgi:hypothetical protein